MISWNLYPLLSLAIGAINPLQPILANWKLWLVGLVILLGLKILRSPSFKGWFGEWAVNRGLKSLPASDYRHFADLYLPHPTEEGTTQIDHVVVSSFGIFVIETKNYRGWIFGSEKQREWTQQVYRRKHRFQNPIHQNLLHVKALMAYLKLPEEYFMPVIIFIGESEFKTPVPDHVLNRGLLGWIRQHQQARIIPPLVAQAINQLEAIDRGADRRVASRAHLAALRARHRS